jgi:hypothetical protein
MKGDELVMNELRRVRIEDDHDISGVISVRARKWHWTAEPPTYTGWYAVRPAGNRMNKRMVFIDQKTPNAPLIALAGMHHPEWSDRPVTWPLEAGSEDSDPEVLWQQYSALWQRESTEQPDDDAEDVVPRWHYVLIFGLGVGCLIGVLVAFALWTVMNH